MEATKPPFFFEKPYSFRTIPKSCWKIPKYTINTCFLMKKPISLQ